jgi:hypothetical protein
LWERLAGGGLAAIREHAIDNVAECLHEAIVSLRPGGGRESLPEPDMKKRKKMDTELVRKTGAQREGQGAGNSG